MIFFFPNGNHINNEIDMVDESFPTIPGTHGCIVHMHIMRKALQKLARAHLNDRKTPSNQRDHHLG